MKPDNIEARKARRKREAVHGVLLFALIQLLTAAVFASLCLIPDSPKGLNILWLVLAGICLLTILPAIWLLKGRFKEIEGGELDAAAEY